MVSLKVSILQMRTLRLEDQRGLLLGKWVAGSGSKSVGHGALKRSPPHHHHHPHSPSIAVVPVGSEDWVDAACTHASYRRESSKDEMPRPTRSGTPKPPEFTVITHQSQPTGSKDRLYLRTSAGPHTQAVQGLHVGSVLFHLDASHGIPGTLCHSNELGLAHGAWKELEERN